MKRVFFALLAVGMIASFESCKKCGYCRYSNGSTDAAVCRNSTLAAVGADDYAQTKANCDAAGGTWVISK